MKNRVFCYVLCLLLTTSCGKKYIETKPITKDVTETVFANGVLEANTTYNLTAQVEGYLQQVSFIEGSIVQQGQLLATIDNKESGFNKVSANELYNIATYNTKENAPALQQAKNNIVIAKQKLEQEANQYKRYKTLWEQNSIAKVDYENALLQYNIAQENVKNAEETYKQLQQSATQQSITTSATKSINEIIQNKNNIYALVKGKVFKKYKQVGDFVKKGDVIATIGSAQNIYAKVNIDESYIAKIKIGQEAVLQLNTNKEKPYKGIVSEIYPQFDEATQSFICKIQFTDSLDFTIVGTQLQVNIAVDTSKNALLIPRRFVDFSNHVQVKGEQEKRVIQTKFVSNEWVQVLSGIDVNTILIAEVPTTKSSGENSLIK